MLAMFLMGYNVKQRVMHPDKLIECVTASLSLLDVAPYHITYPLLASVYRAPLGEALTINYSHFILAHTGYHKSVLAALAQAHYGAGFDYDNLPENWTSTGNFIERRNFLIKDALFVVDDYVADVGADAAGLQRKAAQVFRGAANKQARGRLRSDASARESYVPRSLVCATGEILPNIESIRARLCIAELNKGDVKKDRLNNFQELARSEKLAGAMSGYIQWLAPRMDSFKDQLRGKLLNLRKSAYREGMHAKMPDNIASLMVGWEVFLKFAFEVGAIDQGQFTDFYEKGWSAIIQSAFLQKRFLVAESDANRFIGFIGTALMMGKAHLADSVDDGAPAEGHLWGWERSEANDVYHPKGAKIGWVNSKNGEVLLAPEAAYTMAQQIASQQNQKFTTSKEILIKRLAEEGIVERSESEGKNTAKRKVPNPLQMFNTDRPRVLVIKDKSVLSRFTEVLKAPVAPEAPVKAGDPDVFSSTDRRKEKKLLEMQEWADQKMGASKPGAPITH